MAEQTAKSGGCSCTVATPMMEIDIACAGAGGCQKFPKEDEMQGRSRICHDEVGKEEAEGFAQSPEQ